MKKICLLTAAGIFIVAFVFILFLPFLLSSSFVLEKALTHVNKQSTGSFTILDCSIGWFRGVVCDNIGYKCIDNGLVLNIEQLSGDRGLLALLAAPKNTGVIHLYKPVLEWSADSEDSCLLGKKNKKYNEREGQIRGGVEDIPFWEKYIVRLVIEGGMLVLNPPESSIAVTTPLRVDFSLSANLSSGTVKYNLQSSLDKDGGVINVEGVINLPARRKTFFETIITRHEVRVEQLDPTPFLALVSPKFDTSFASGLMTGFFTLASSGRKQLDLFGSVEINELKLNKGWAGDAYLGFDLLNVKFDGGLRNGYNWFCNELIVEHEHGKLIAKGGLSSDTMEANLTASLQVTGNQTVGGIVDLRAAGFFTPSRVLIRELDVQVRDLMFVVDGGVPTIQNEIFLRSLKPEVDEETPVIIRELEIATSLEDWQKHGGGLSGYDWQEKFLFANNLQIGGELHGGNIFARVHPLFGILTTATGRLDLLVDKLYWPLLAEREEEAFFTTVLDVSRVSFKSRPILSDIFTHLLIDEKPLELRGDKIYCKGEAGRITCSPVVMLMPDSELVVIGSTGMDQSLDYQVLIPVGEEQSDWSGIYLQGTVVEPVFRGKRTEDRGSRSEGRG